MRSEPRASPLERLSRTRFALVACIAAAGLAAALALRLDPRDLVPEAGGAVVAREFFARALAPAWTYESEVRVAGARPLVVKALTAAHSTVVFAAAAALLSLLLALPLALLASDSWWRRGWAGEQRSRHGPALLFYGVSRVVIALMRSVHELLWAVLFLAAFGLSHLSAVVAIGVPYGGTLAKVFSEMIDEVPRGPADALADLGARPLQVFLFGLLPRAAPDMAAYAFYRFECAVRASAVLGFFGFPTLGFFIAASFENLYYGEVWTYLYVLFGLVLALEWWSGAVRRGLRA